MAETEQIDGAQIQRAAQAGAVPASSSPVDKALALASGLRERVMAMPSAKRTWLFASLAFLAALSAGAIWFAGRPDWRVLFSGLDGKDVQQVSQELAAAGIPYETTADGSGVEVSGGHAGQSSHGGSGKRNAVGMSSVDDRGFFS